MGTAELRYYKLMGRGQRDYLTLGKVICKMTTESKVHKLFLTAEARAVATGDPGGGGGGGTPTNCHTGVCRSIGSILKGQFP